MQVLTLPGHFTSGFGVWCAPTLSPPSCARDNCVILCRQLSHIMSCERQALPASTAWLYMLQVPLVPNECSTH